MLHNKANKSKILALILGLTMCLALMLGIVLANPVDTARAEETDPRTVVSTITANSDVDTIIGFGNRVVRPSFNIEGDVPALFSTSGDWQRKTATGDWEYYSGAAFTEGTYRYKTQIRIEDTGATTHVLDKNGITVTVNGVKWADNSIPQIYDTYSFDWVYSKEYEVLAPAGTPLDFIKNDSWDIDSTYINQAITAFSVADGAAGGTKPYAFSKVSGPEWIDVAADGAVSGTPTAVGANADLVIKVTDSAAEPATKEITLRVGNTYVLPADREVISVIKATSNIGEILGYGKSVVDPLFTLWEGTQAKFSNTMGHWYKKEGTAWKRYEEATFTEGTYMYSNQLRVDDEAGRTHVLNKDGVSVYIDTVLCADNQKPDAIYDTYSLIYVDTAEHEVVKAVNDELVSVTDLEKVFNETAQEPTFGGTLVRGSDFEVSYAVKVGAGGALDFSEKPVNAGTYIVTVTGKGAYEGSFTKEFVIKKAAQSDIPVGLIANPIPCRDGSGTIDGVTTAMEYRKVGDADYTKCTLSKITGLAAGEYQIRYAENDNYLASADVTVTIEISHNFGTLIEETPATCIDDGMKAHYYCSACEKYFDESKTETTETALTIPATGVHTFGTFIDETPATCIDDGMKAHYYCSACEKYFDESKTETTETALTIPATGVHTFGTFIDETPATCIADGMKAHYKCTVCGKYFDESGNEITDLTISINPNAHDFGAWTDEVPATCVATGTKGHKDCNRCNKHYDKSGNEITDLTIPINPNAHDFGAWKDEVPATCVATGTKGHKDCSGCNKHYDKSGNEITDLTIPINPNAHDFGAMKGEIPATCIAGGMKAHYKCTVCGKYFDADKNETTEEALKTPVSPYYGHSFGRWVEEQYATCQAPGRKGYKHCSTCNKDYDASNTEITDFVIPVNPDGHELGDLVAEVPATCKDTGVKAHRDCRLCGKHCDPITRKEIADLTIPTTNNHTYGELIPEVPATTTEFGVKEHKDCSVCGKHFDKDGNEITELRIAKIGTHNVVINGESKFYVHGERATVTAEDKDGKVFKGWKDASGNIVSTNKSYTFTVNGETTLTAVYEDKTSGGGVTGGAITPTPDKKDGLSGGAIAGIVIGSVAVAAIGGFSIFWFAVKKKTFADLGIALKKGFTAIGNFFKTLGAKIKALFTKKK